MQSRIKVCDRMCRRVARVVAAVVTGLRRVSIIGGPTALSGWRRRGPDGSPARRVGRPVRRPRCQRRPIRLSHCGSRRAASLLGARQPFAHERPDSVAPSYRVACPSGGPAPCATAPPPSRSARPHRYPTRRFAQPRSTRYLSAAHRRSGRSLPTHPAHAHTTPTSGWRRSSSPPWSP